MISKAPTLVPPIDRREGYQFSIVEFFGCATYRYLVLPARPQMIDVVSGMN